jgi:hypothetical protein
MKLSDESLSIIRNYKIANSWTSNKALVRISLISEETHTSGDHWW